MHRPPLPPGNVPGTHFHQGLSRHQGHGTVGRNMSLKNPVTPPGIDPGTVRLVAQRLNQYATPVSRCYLWVHLRARDFFLLSFVFLLSSTHQFLFYLAKLRFCPPACVGRLLQSSSERCNIIKVKTRYGMPVNGTHIQVSIIQLSVDVWCY